MDTSRLLIVTGLLVLPSAFAAPVLPGADENSPSRSHYFTWIKNTNETYIDVHMINRTPATHNRAAALDRGLPPGLRRLAEDCGVCISSCLDYWEDDLILQAFNRSRILAPQIYGSPWFPRDNEFPGLARIFNLHRKYRDILIRGIVLPEKTYGPHAVSRGNDKTRLVTSRNLTWEAVTYKVALDESIGLTAAGAREARLFHPYEEILGRDLSAEGPWKSPFTPSAPRCIDFGGPVSMDQLKIHTQGDDQTLSRILMSGAEFGKDLVSWKSATGVIQHGDRLDIYPPAGEWRYFRMRHAPERAAEVEGFLQGRPIDRGRWTASNLFAHPDALPAVAAWSATAKDLPFTASS